MEKGFSSNSRVIAILEPGQVDYKCLCTCTPAEMCRIACERAFAAFLSQVFGEMSLITGGAASASIVAGNHTPTHTLDVKLDRDALVTLYPPLPAPSTPTPLSFKDQDETTVYMFDGAQLHTGFVRQPSIAGIYDNNNNNNNAIVIMIRCALGS